MQENAPAGLFDLYAYTYDEAGNRESEQQGSAVQTTTHNARNQAEQRSAGGPFLVRARLAPEPAAGPWLNDTTTMQPKEEDKGPYAAPLQANVYRAQFNVTPAKRLPSAATITTKTATSSRSKRARPATSPPRALTRGTPATASSPGAASAPRPAPSFTIPKATASPKKTAPALYSIVR